MNDDQVIRTRSAPEDPTHSAESPAVSPEALNGADPSDSTHNSDTIALASTPMLVNDELSPPVAAAASSVCVATTSVDPSPATGR